MKKQTRNITIALALSLFTAGVVASIPSEKSLLAPESLSSDSGGGGGSGSGYRLSLGWCSKSWICRDGVPTITTGTSDQCVRDPNLYCDPSQQRDCNAPRPACMN